jgi:hypothetical protein
MLSLCFLPGYFSLVFAANADPVISTTELVAMMRTITLQLLPNPLHDKTYNWGTQRNAPNGITWVKKGILLKPQVQMKLKNDGIWRKIRAEAIDAQTTLNFGLDNLSFPQEGMMTFDINVNLPVRVFFEQQVWESGIKLYSGETRLRCLAGVVVKCEMTNKLEKKEGSFFPDLVIKVRALEAKVGYADLVVEHVLGVDGKLAKELGEIGINLVKEIKPSLEGQLLTKANAAVVKAADTKEIRLGLSQLLKNRKK